jgi:hypothetical protein
MRKGVWRVDRRGANAVDGNVVWAPAKSLWNVSMYAAGSGCSGFQPAWVGLPYARRVLAQQSSRIP